MEKSNINLDKSIPGHIQKKWPCPSCNKKRFVRFYNFTTQEYLDEKYGRCDREENCGYYFSPYQDPENKNMPERQREDWTQPKPIEKINFVPHEIVTRTLDLYEHNTFVAWLITICSFDIVMEMVFKYFVGTAKNNGTIFWQVDQFKRCRTGTKIHYDKTGHRIKAIDPQKLFKQADDYKSCLFGEHLLFDISPNSFIALVESEKSAIIASIYMPNLGNRPICWMATSGSNGLTYEKIEALRDRDIILVPDFSFHARATWGQVLMRKKKNEKGIMVPHPDGEMQVDYESAKTRLEKIGCRVRFYHPCDEIEDGTDIADYFIKEKPATNYYMPDLSEFDLSVPTSFPRSGTKEIFDLTTSSGNVRAFRVLKNDAGENEIECGFPEAKKYLERLIKKNPVILDLFSKFKIYNGELKPMSHDN